MSDSSTLLQVLHEQLEWPSVEDILEPPGAGPAFYARLAREKIGRALQRLTQDDDIWVGVLVPDSRAPDTVVPLAVVCEFNVCETSFVVPSYGLKMNMSEWLLVSLAVMSAASS